MPKIGETLYMYTGLRTANTELITNKEKLISMQQVRVSIRKMNTAGYDIKISVDGRRLTELEISQFVKFDGFTDRVDFAEYWLRDEKGKKITRVGASMVQFHWTDLRY